MPSKTLTGGDAKLDAEVFEASFNGPLVHESVRAELAARRQGPQLRSFRLCQHQSHRTSPRHRTLRLDQGQAYQTVPPHHYGELLVQDTSIARRLVWKTSTGP